MGPNIQKMERASYQQYLKAVNDIVQQASSNSSIDMTKSPMFKSEKTQAVKRKVYALTRGIGVGVAVCFIYRRVVA